MNEEYTIMEFKLRENLGSILTIFSSIMMILIMVIGYFLNRTMNEIDNNFNETNKIILIEKRERIKADETLELKLDTKLSRREFNLYIQNLENINEDINEIQKDIKELLKK